MALIDDLKWRYAIKNTILTKVSQEDVDKIVEAARFSSTVRITAVQSIGGK
jgi:nitroreductase